MDSREKDQILTEHHSIGRSLIDTLDRLEDHPDQIYIRYEEPGGRVINARLTEVPARLAIAFMCKCLRPYIESIAREIEEIKRKLKNTIAIQ